MDSGIWIVKAACTMHRLIGIYGPAYTLSGEGEVVRACWSEHHVEWRVPSGHGSDLADRLRQRMAAEQALKQDQPEPREGSAAIGMTEEVLDRCAYFLFPRLRVLAKHWPSRPDHPAEKALAREVIEEALWDLARYTHAMVRVDLELVDRYRKAHVFCRGVLGPTGDAIGRPADVVDRAIEARDMAAQELANAVVAALDADRPKPGRPDVVIAGQMVDHQTPKGVVFVPPVDLRAVDSILVAAYRKAAAEAVLSRKWAPTEMLRPDIAEVRDEAAVALADDVARRADAIVTASSSLLGQLQTLVHSASYTLGNPMSGLGGNTTVQAALGALREVEMLLDREGAG